MEIDPYETKKGIAEYVKTKVDKESDIFKIFWQYVKGRLKVMYP